MININPALKDRNPVLRESSFIYIMKRKISDISDHLDWAIDRNKPDNILIFAEEELYDYLDNNLVNCKPGNILTILMIRHGIHYVVEAILYLYVDLNTVGAETLRKSINYDRKNKIYGIQRETNELL